MASTLNPYLQFRDTARPTMEYYREVFGGDLNLSTFGDFGDPSQPNANLTTPSGFTLMASDTPPGMDYSPGTNISVSLSGDDAAELRGYWEKLSDGGTVSLPLEKQMWGDEFGQCTDKFGIRWMVNIAG